MFGFRRRGFFIPSESKQLIWRKRRTETFLCGMLDETWGVALNKSLIDYNQANTAVRLCIGVQAFFDRYYAPKWLRARRDSKFSMRGLPLVPSSSQATSVRPTKLSAWEALCNPQTCCALAPRRRYCNHGRTCRDRYFLFSIMAGMYSIAHRCFETIRLSGAKAVLWNPEFWIEKWDADIPICYQTFDVIHALCLNWMAIFHFLTSKYCERYSNANPSWQFTNEWRTRSPASKVVGWLGSRRASRQSILISGTR